MAALEGNAPPDRTVIQTSSGTRYVLGTEYYHKALIRQRVKGLPMRQPGSTPKYYSERIFTGVCYSCGQCLPSGLARNWTTCPGVTLQYRYTAHFTQSSFSYTGTICTQLLEYRDGELWLA